MSKSGRAMHWRGKFAVLACLAVVGSTVAACGGGSSADSQGGNLEFWTINLKEGYQSYIENSINAYEKAHPGTHVKWTDIPDFEQTQSKLLAAISGGATPDVVNVTPFILPKFASTNSVYSIDELTKDVSAVQAKYVPSLWDAGVINGKSYAIPYYGSVSSLVYNAQLFQQAGLDPNNPPTTWDQVFQDARIIHEKTGVSGFTQTLDNFDDAGNPADILAGEAGVPLLDNSGKHAAFNTPAAEKILASYTQGVQDGSIDKTSATGVMMDSAKLLAQGKTGMVFLGPWILRWVKDNSSPDLFQNLRVADHPHGAGGAANGFLQDFAIPRASQHPQQALDFAQYMASTSIQLCKQAPLLPALQSQTQDPYFQSAPELKALVDQQMKFYWPKVPAVSELFDQLQKSFQAAYLGQKSARQALDEAATQWNQTLAAGS